MVLKKSKNLTSHTYHEETAKIVYNSAKEFLIEVEYFLKKLEEKIHD